MGEPKLDHDKYAAYLNQHLVAADGGVESFKAAANTWAGTAWAEVFEQLYKEEQESHAKVKALIESLGYDISAARNAVAGLAAAAGRFNPLNPTRDRNGRMSQAELDALVTAIMGQQAMWETLAVLSEMDPRLDATDCTSMIERCEDQRRRVRVVSQETAKERFTQADVS